MYIVYSKSYWIHKIIHKTILQLITTLGWIYLANLEHKDIKLQSHFEIKEFSNKAYTLRVIYPTYTIDTVLVVLKFFQPTDPDIKSLTTYKLLCIAYFIEMLSSKCISDCIEREWRIICILVSVYYYKVCLNSSHV